MNDFIEIKGARENNLKNLTLRIPKNKLVVLTGISGSGKSTLAFDTLQKECQRQYMASLGVCKILFEESTFNGRYGYGGIHLSKVVVCQAG